MYMLCICIYAKSLFSCYIYAIYTYIYRYNFWWSLRIYASLAQEGASWGINENPTNASDKHWCHKFAMTKYFRMTCLV